MRTERVRMGSLEGVRRVSPWRRRAAALFTAVTVFTVGGIWFWGVGAVDEPASAPGVGEAAGPEPAEAETKPSGPRARAEAAGIALSAAPAGERIGHRFGSRPAAGMLFDVETGEILWQRRPERELRIASLTKMMTAHLIAKRHSPDERVAISRRSVAVGGSMIGLLPKGKKVPLGTLLKGLLLVSGNDAAVALAEHDAGKVERFVDRMNAEASRLGLSCTRFSSPHGLLDRGNHSCARDLASMARLVLGNRRLAKITASGGARMDFPISGGVLELANNNPFIRRGDRTVTGVKTGYTDAAGRCYVMSAERGGRHLGVVLLDSPDPVAQVEKLWRLGSKRKG